VTRRVGYRALTVLGLWLTCAASAGCGRADTTTLLFVGDMMLGRHVERLARERQDWVFPFRRIVDRVRGATIAFGNLECIAAEGGAPTPFRADPRVLEGLRDAGFDVVSVANNHAMDAGPEALDRMLRRLRALGITPTGVRTDAGQDVAIVHANGLRVGFLAYSWFVGDFPPAAGLPLIAGTDRAEMVADIARARPAVDYLVVSLHMGLEGARHASEPQRQKARAAIDAGADLVVGHHPHVPQELERYRGKPIAYSLGDFVFDHPDVSVEGAMLEVALRDRRVTGLAWLATRIDDELRPNVVGETRWAGDVLAGPDGPIE
jgi:poly-gamma-glutamate synthesis protein (capsule biosynthesis protein)